MIDKAKLKEYTAQLGIPLDEGQLEQFDLYARTLVEWNEKINLTAILDPEGILVKHFLDSLMLLTVIQPGEGERLIDVGTGAGFPSIPVKIARPDLNLTLLDSLNKRINFLKELSGLLGQENECIHFRAEEAGQKKEYRGRYQFSTARAVAHLRELSEYCIPFLQQGGKFAALKSGNIEQELKESEKAIHILGGKIVEIRRFSLPDASPRSIILVEKISQTPTGYPRPSAKIAKKPLV